MIIDHDLPGKNV